MSQPGPRFRELFLEVYESLPGNGAGYRACAARALGLYCDLPQSPAILDLECGVGGQTLRLATSTDCHVVSTPLSRASFVQADFGANDGIEMSAERRSHGALRTRTAPRRP